MNVIFHHFSKRLTMRRYSKRVKRSLNFRSKIGSKASFARDYTWYRVNYKDKNLSLETASLYKKNEFGYKRPKITLATWSEDLLYSDNEEY